MQWIAALQEACHFKPVRHLYQFIPSLALLLFGLAATPASAHQAGGIRADPVSLNIGLVCQWQRACIAKQRSAMTKSLKYVAKYKPPQWRLHLCNKNASRGGQRKDWVGFDQCVRNEKLRPPPPRSPARKTSSVRSKRG